MAGIAYLDTNVFTDALEGEDSLSAPVKALFDAASAMPGTLVTRELTLAEVLAPKGRKTRPADLRRRYVDLIVWGGVIDLRPVSREVIYETVELRPYAPLKPPDAIHPATAILAGCRYLVRRDQEFRKMPTSMVKVAQGTEAFAEVLAALR